MRWTDSQKIISACVDYETIKSHTQVPTILDLKTKLRIYFATRPKPQYSVISAVDVMRDAPENILEIHDYPMLEGASNEFDEHGVMPSCVYAENEKIYMLYTGMQRQSHIPYKSRIGLAVSHDQGLHFSRLNMLHFPESQHDLALAATRVVDGNDIHFFYSKGNFKKEMSYTIAHVKLAREKLIKNERFQFPSHAVSFRPSIIKIEDVFHMFYCHREVKGQYQLAHAISNDLNNWETIPTFTQFMQSYPAVIQIDDQIFLFYASNDYGKSGIGYSRLFLS